MKLNRLKSLSPPQVLVLSFAVLIGAGMLLLKTPLATTESLSWVDALFTATSAVTVTGLITVDTGSAFTLFGQIVILFLIQIGGLGIMSVAVLIFLMLGKRIGISERLMIQQALNQSTFSGLVRLVKKLFFFSVTIESAAMVALAFRFVPEFGWMKGIYVSIFHSISAFNNAGFSIWSDSLSRYVGDPLINTVISFSFIIGGIGFTVLSDLFQSKSFKLLSLHTKLMLIGTLGINVIAFLLVLLFEWNNQSTLGPLSLTDKLWASYFQGVTTRTAGFNTIEIGQLEHTTLWLMLLFMFVGAGSASTGGGIKLTTFVIIILAASTFLKGRSDIVVFRKTIPPPLLLKSLAIATISVLFIFAATLVLTMTERKSLLHILFEVVSAFGTVGISMGMTADLSVVGKLIIVFIMFLGKIGPLTLAFSFAKKITHQFVIRKKAFSLVK
ncbi:Ktr system potassium transporter B [Bacillaceae bacterium SIJ1]|nr:Ktr system potassium transporter B [Litoribacterium kuwaitense]